MALTTTQRAQIRFYLGYSDVSQGASPNRLEGAMDSITSEAETIVTAILSQLVSVDAQFTSSTALSSAGLKQVDNGGVEWFGASSAQSSLSATGRRLVARLSAMFGVTIAADVYGSSVATSGPMGLG